MFVVIQMVSRIGVFYKIEICNFLGNCYKILILYFIRMYVSESLYMNDYNCGFFLQIKFYKYIV